MDIATYGFFFNDHSPISDVRYYTDFGACVKPVNNRADGIIQLLRILTPFSMFAENLSLVLRSISGCRCRFSNPGLSEEDEDLAFQVCLPPYPQS